MNEETTFKTAPGDPAIPGDPFVRLRYHYGMLLGAEDFSVEQREKVLRRRLHQALLHGAGTVWGLRVEAGAEDEDQRRRQIVVQPGLAVDVLGRDVYVDAKQCLDVSGLAQNPIWTQLEPPPNACSKTDRRAYVVLRYEACQALPVPAIAPPCNEPGDAEAYSRILDRFRIDLVASPPEDPHALAREWLAALLNANPHRAPRDILLEFLIGKPGESGVDLAPLARFFRAPMDAPILLAAVDLELDPAGCNDARLVHVLRGPDNGVRALLPPLQAIGESLFGTRLSGPAPGPGKVPFQAISWKLDNCKDQIRVRMSAKPHKFALLSKPVLVHRLEETGWNEVAVSNLFWDAASHELVVQLEQDMGDGSCAVTWHLWIAGEAQAPLIAENLTPLMGLVGDPITHPRRGRDVSILDTWTPRRRRHETDERAD